MVMWARGRDRGLGWGVKELGWDRLMGGLELRRRIRGALKGALFGSGRWRRKIEEEKENYRSTCSGSRDWDENCVKDPVANVQRGRNTEANTATPSSPSSKIKTTKTSKASAPK